MRNLIIGLCCIVLLSVAGAAAAQDTFAPNAVAETIRDLLFDAQSALLGDDSAAASRAVADADALYRAELAAALTSADRQTADLLDSAFAAATRAAASGDDLALAVARGQVWTTLLGGGYYATIDALDSDDGGSAAAWLLLRDFRASTRFSRPNADATLAVQGFSRGDVALEAALAAVRADLLDTYQAQLNASLLDADEADTRGFALRRAEEVGLAAGYFAILSDAYAEQRGADGLADANAMFTALLDAAATGDSAAYAAARADVDAVIAGFRAAPLSEIEQARRAGQLIRFITLVPIEYARGVRNGVVTIDLEIQEARTFREGALAAFNDLKASLAALDAEAVAEIAALFDTVGTQIDTVADPAALQSSVERMTALLNATMPESWSALNTDSDFDVILSVLDQVETAVAQGQYALAESARLEAYAILELGMEQRLRGFAPDLAIRIESLFWNGTQEQVGLAALLANAAPQREVAQGVDVLRAALREGQTMLETARSAPEAVVGNAAVIVFREGLEAVLILASLLASLRTAEERRFRNPIIAGGALALVATAATWWAANQLLTVLLPYGERLEAVVSLIAIGVLLVIMNWFIHKVYWTGWIANFHSRKRQLIGGAALAAFSQIAGLMLLGFTSIYREGFETVLFLQSLVLDAGIGVVLRGVALGMAGVIVVGIAVFFFQARLPYKKMLIVTGIMISFVLFTMVGHTVNTLQAVGWLPLTPINGVFLPYWMGQWFGLFATWQSILLQLASLVFVIGSYFLAEHLQANKRHAAATRQAATAA
jgi:high-affinity iron transporter